MRRRNFSPPPPPQRKRFLIPIQNSLLTLPPLEAPSTVNNPSVVQYEVCKAVTGLRRAQVTLHTRCEEENDEGETGDMKLKIVMGPTVVGQTG